MQFRLYTLCLAMIFCLPFAQARTLLPPQALTEALFYLQANPTLFPNKKYISIINFAQNSAEKRLYIVNLKSGAILNLHVAHGRGSDQDGDGFAERFSNLAKSNASSLGVFRVGESYEGKHGLSLRLDGLQNSNNNARDRAVVLHGASYVNDKDIPQGRSWGCPAISLTYRDQVIDMLKGGSLLYAIQNPKRPVKNFSLNESRAELEKALSL